MPLRLKLKPQEKIVIGRREIDSTIGQTEKQTIKYLNDNSWKEEIFEFADCIINNKDVVSGSSFDALKCMKLVFGIYFNDKEWRDKYNITDPTKI